MIHQLQACTRRRGARASGALCRGWSTTNTIQKISTPPASITQLMRSEFCCLESRVQDTRQWPDTALTDHNVVNAGSIFGCHVNESQQLILLGRCPHLLNLSVRHKLTAMSGVGQRSWNGKALNISAQKRTARNKRAHVPRKSWTIHGPTNF